MRVEDTFWISVSEQIKIIVSRATELRVQKRYITITEHDRTWCCPACGETHNRDVNASIDLYLVGLGRFERGIVEQALVKTVAILRRSRKLN